MDGLFDSGDQYNDNEDYEDLENNMEEKKFAEKDRVNGLFNNDSEKNHNARDATAKGAILDQVQPPNRKVRAQTYKRKVSISEQHDPQSKKRRLHSQTAADVAVPPAATHGVAETNSEKLARPQKRRGWKGYALVDVEDADVGHKEEVKGSSQETGGNAHGHVKLRKSKRKM
ncbi:hypothetical protein DFH28DRAFT_921715 [Melampsora americana]|nr:hypothetical protein DFH28DRAFT_921715 [Melampsora americana]